MSDFEKFKRFIVVSHTAYETFRGISNSSSFDSVAEALADIVSPTFIGDDYYEILDCKLQQVVWSEEMISEYINDFQNKNKSY